MANPAIIILIVFVVLIVVAVIVIVGVVAFAQEGVGKSCTTASNCGDGTFVCLKGKCLKKDGQFCIKDSECASNNCKDGSCQGTIPTSPCTGPSGTQGSCPTRDLCSAKGQCLGGIFGPCKQKSDCFYPNAVCTGLNGNSTKVCLSGVNGPCTGGTGCTSGLTCCSDGFCKTTCTSSESELMSAFRPTLVPPGMNLGLGSERWRPPSTSLPGISAPTTTTFYADNVLPTRAERMENFHTPSSREVGAPLKKIRKDMAISHENPKESPVIDVTSYSNSTLALTKDGKIIRESPGKKREIIANNIRLKRLESFNGTLYGISVDGRVFQLNNDTFDTRKWLWNLAPLPTGINHTSATLDGRHFWVQTNETGLLYDRQFRVVDRAPIRNLKRIYGNNKNVYIEIDMLQNVGTLHPDGKQIKDVAGAILTHDNQLKVLRPSQTNFFSDIRLLDWTPTYILKTL